jgi:hypothetical protein
MGMGWYTPASWKRLRAIAADVVISYPKFVERTERTIRELESQGVIVEKYFIDIDHMIEWCRRNGYAVDGPGRARYGVVLAMHDGKLFDLDTPVVDRTRVAH